MVQMREPKLKTKRKMMLRVLLVCLFCASVLSFTRTPLQMTRSGNSANDYTSELSTRKKSAITKLRIASERSQIKISPEKNLSCDLKIKSPIESFGGPLTCYFEKSSSCSSCKSGICPVDNRPCDANRDYMDHIYGARFMPKPKPTFQAYKYSQQSQMHMYASAPVPVVPERKLTAAERRTRRQKLFLMSTWLEDLLPNPSQGRSWMINSVCDTMKITTRVGRFIVSFITMLTTVPTASSPSEERNHRDSTSHGGDHL